MNPQPASADQHFALLIDYVDAIARRDPAFRQRLINRLSSPTTQPVEIEHTQSPATLKKSAEAYKGKLDADVRSGELSMSNSNRQKASLSVMFRNVCDQPLQDLSYAPLADMVAKIKDRKTNGLSPDSIQTAIRDIRLFFGWLEDSGHWIPQFNAQRLFRVRKHKLMTIAESHQAALGKPVFTPAELKLLYRAASKEMRLFILLGLNLAATQQQIADLLMGDIHLGATPPYVEFIRGKTRHSGTGILAHYELWPETAALLRRRIAKTPKTSDGWAILTRDGERMVSFRENGTRQDTIMSSWRLLREKVQLPEDRNLSFKYLRKTIADFVLRLSDEPTQQLMLAHARRSMAAKHYTGKADFAKLGATLRRVRTETLEALFIEVRK